MRHRALLAALKACKSSGDLERLKQLHAAAEENGEIWASIVSRMLVSLYAKCGQLFEAQRLFERTLHRDDVAAWNSLMLGYVGNGEGSLALELFANMTLKYASPDAVSLIAAAKACVCQVSNEEVTLVSGESLKLASLSKGTALHAFARRRGLESDKHVASSLANMYSKCGSLTRARRIFNHIQDPDTVCWNVLTFGYAENGEGRRALETFMSMLCEGHVPNSLSFVAALKSCADMAVHENGKQAAGKLVKVEALMLGVKLHNLAVYSGYNRDRYVLNTLVDVYAKCGDMNEASRVFFSMQKPDVVSWTALILGYVENGEEDLAFTLFERMKECCLSNDRTILAVIKACIALASKEEVGKNLVKAISLKKAREVHLEAVKCGYTSDVCVATALVNLYSKCGSMVDAFRTFEGMKHRNVVSWTALISGYADNGEPLLALECFTFMQSDRCAPDSLTFIAVLRACVNLAEKEKPDQFTLVKLGTLEKGMDVHCQAASKFCNLGICLANTLVDMYAKCGCMHDAHKVFDGMSHNDVVSWTVLILGYADNGEGHVAFDLFRQMQSKENCQPNSLSFVAALKACTATAMKEEAKLLAGQRPMKMRALEAGMSIHSQITRSGFQDNVFVACTLVDMYAKCGNLVDAQLVFDGMSQRTVISWNALLFGYLENGEGECALDAYASMRREGCPPDASTFVAAVKASAMAGDLEKGEETHKQVCHFKMHKVLTIGNTLIDFYGKCGKMSSAQQVFDHMETRDSVTWNALISGYGRLGDHVRVFTLFKAMTDGGIQADAVTFSCLLATCSHAGLVDKARDLFQGMWSKHGVHPTIEHYHCMIDILGRVNELEDAVRLVNCMPLHPCVVTWRIVLDASRKWKNVAVAKLAYDTLLARHEDASAMVLMSGTYMS